MCNLYPQIITFYFEKKLQSWNIIMFYGIILTTLRLPLNLNYGITGGVDKKYLLIRHWDDFTQTLRRPISPAICMYG